MTVQNRIVTGTRLLLLLAATGAVCLGQMPPIDSREYAAKVLTLTGQVSVLKDSTPWALNGYGCASSRIDVARTRLTS